MKTLKVTFDKRKDGHNIYKPAYQANQDCNLILRINPNEYKIPVISHNLRGFDSHFITQEIGSIGKKQ